MRSHYGGQGFLTGLVPSTTEADWCKHLSSSKFHGYRTVEYIIRIQPNLANPLELEQLGAQHCLYKQCDNEQP